MQEKNNQAPPGQILPVTGLFKAPKRKRQAPVEAGVIQNSTLNVGFVGFTDGSRPFEWHLSMKRYSDGKGYKKAFG